MKRLPIALFAFLLVLAAGLIAQDVMIIKVKVQAANVRSQPDMNGAVIRQVKLGTLLESRQKSGDWFEVTITDEKGSAVSGYINATVVDIVSGGGKAGGQTGGQQAEVKKPAEGAATIIVQQQVQQGQTNQQTQAQSQSGGAGGSGGFKIMGGIGLANLSLTWPADADPELKTLFDKYRQSRMGYNGGIGVEMGGRIGLELDVLYLQKGVRFKGVYDDPDTKVSTSFDYNTLFEEISLPILLKFHVLDLAAGPDIYLMGGGEVAYVLGGKTTYSYTQAGQTTNGSEKIEKANLNQIDYGAIVGGGFGLDVIGLKFFVEARYHIGMSNLEKSTTGTEAEGTENVKPKTSLLLLMAGFKF